MRIPSNVRLISIITLFNFNLHFILLTHDILVGSQRTRSPIEDDDMRCKIIGLAELVLLLFIVVIDSCLRRVVIPCAR